MDRRRFELVTIAVARARASTYCTVARCFFTAVLDGLGAQLDVQTAQTFAPAVLESMVVGRPVAGS